MMFQLKYTFIEWKYTCLTPLRRKGISTDKTPLSSDFCYRNPFRCSWCYHMEGKKTTSVRLGIDIGAGSFKGSKYASEILLSFGMESNVTSVDAT